MKRKIICCLLLALSVMCVTAAISACGFFDDAADSTSSESSFDIIEESVDSAISEDSQSGGINADDDSISTYYGTYYSINLDDYGYTYNFDRYLIIQDGGWTGSLGYGGTCEVVDGVFTLYLDNAVLEYYWEYEISAEFACTFTDEILEIECTSAKAVAVESTDEDIADWIFDELVSLVFSGSTFYCYEEGYTDEAASEGIVYLFIDNSYTVESIGTCTDTDIVIPSTYDGIPVTRIAMSAFSGCSSITSITIPSSIVSISSGAFSECTSLRAVYITDIAAWCNISFTYYYWINYTCNPLYYAGNLYLDGELVTDLVIPDGVTSVGNGAFYGCTSITGVTIPESVLSVGEYAFSGCSSLLSATIGDNVASLGSHAFSYCTSLSSLYIGSSVSEIGEEALYGCLFTDIAVNADNKVYKSVDGSLYSYDGKTLIQYATGKKDKSFVIPDGVVTIGDCAFSDCSNLLSITVPSSVTEIENWAFVNCCKMVEIYNLSSIELAAGDYSNGYLGVYALDIYTSFDEESKLFTYGDYTFHCSGGEYLLVMYSGEETDLVLPELVLEGVSFGYAINDYAFSGDSIVNVTIPVSVISIGDGAFSGCYSLKNVITGDGVTTIGNFAFSDCTSLESITIGKSVVSIGDYMLSNCTSLKEIYYNAVSADSMPDSIYNNTGRESSGITVTIGAGVECLPDYLFSHAYYITGVIFEDNGSCTSIGLRTFEYCSSLESVYITDLEAWCNMSFGVTDSNPLGYAECLYLNGEVLSGEIVLSDSVTAISSYTFKNSNITGIIIPDSVISIGNGAFYNCTSLESVTITDNVTSIGNYAFYGCSLLTGLSIPDSVTSIGYGVFYGCTSLKSITLGSSVTSISSEAFYGCTSLESVTLGSNLASIGEYAFMDCTSLADISLPQSVTVIGRSAFENTAYYNNEDNWDGGVLYIGSYLIEADTDISGEYHIKEGTIFIAEYAFAECTSLTAVVIPDSVTYLGGAAFFICTSLTAVVIPDSVTYIGSDAFEICTSLTSIVIGSGVTYIGGCVFYNSDSLAAVYYNGTAAEWSEIAIKSDNAILTSDIIYFYAEEGSTKVSGNYWYYDGEGNIVTWYV